MSELKLQQTTKRQKRLTTRRIVMAGVFGAICVVLGVTGLGLIPVPNLAGYATILHLPVILAGVLEGPVVGAFAGLIMGLYSFLTPGPIPPDPIVCFIPRVLIGVVSAYVYRWTAKKHPQIGAALAGILGTVTNTVGFIGLAILMGYVPSAIWIAILPQAAIEMILATVLTVCLVRVIQRAIPAYKQQR